MGYTAFQSNAFQRSAYQISPGGKAQDTGGGANKYYQSYELGKHAWEVKEYNRIQSEKRAAEDQLALKEAEIEALELKRLQKKALSNQIMQAELMALFVEAQRLNAEKEYLEAMIRRFMIEQDDIMVILMCLPFCA